VTNLFHNATGSEILDIG